MDHHRKLEIVYRAIGELMPVQGRDYTLDVTFDNDVAHIVLKSLTPIGSAFVAHCNEHLSTTIKELTNG